MLLLNWLLRPRRRRLVNKPATKPHSYRLTIEELETRLAPANFFWTGATNGNWNVGSNWQGGVVPPTDGTATLVFDTANLSGAQTKTTNNNLSGTQYAGLELAGGGGFTLNVSVFDLVNSGAGVTDSSTAGVNTIDGFVTFLAGNQAQTITAAAGAHLKFTNFQPTAMQSSILSNSLNFAGAGKIETKGIFFRNGSFLVSSVADGVVNGELSNQNQSAPAGGSLVVVNSGKLALSAANIFAGNVVVNGGTLVASNNNSFGGASKSVLINNASTLELDNGISVGFFSPVAVKFTAGGTLRVGDGTNVDINNLQSGTTTPAPLTIDGPNGGKLTINIPINALGSPTTAPLNVTGNNFTVTTSKASGSNSNNGIGDVAVGTGVTLNLNFFGTPALAIPADLTVDGTVVFQTGSNSNQIAATSNVTLNAGGVLNLNGFSNTIASLTGAGQAQLGTGTLTINNTAADTFDGTFTGTGNLNKTGAGTLTLTGNSAAFAGVNKVMGGAEAVNGTLGGSVIVSGGATLGGVGTVGALKTSSTQEKIDAGPLGNSSTGILHAGATTLDNKATFMVVLNAAAATLVPQAGTDYDQLLSTGAVSLASATLNVQLGGSFGAAAGRIFTIVKGTSLAGTFAGLANGTILTVGGTRFQITYDATSVALKELGTPTTTTLNIGYSTQPANAVYGQLVTFTVDVKATTGGAPATAGTVTVSSGTTNFGTQPVSNGQAVINAIDIPVGTYSSVVAHYSGGGAFEASDSTPAQILIVDKASTTVVLDPSPFVTINFGETGPLTGAVFVTSPGSGAGTGTMRFVMSGGALPSPQQQDVTLPPTAVAAADLSSLLPSATQYFVSGQYLGDDNFNASPVPNPGPRVSVTVNKATTSGAITSINPDPSTVGTPVTYTMILTVPPKPGSIVAPTGTVTFFEGANPIGSPVSSPFTPVSGSNNTKFQVTLSGITLPVGSYTITAQYSGDSNYAASTTPGVTQTVTTNTGPAVAITTFSTPIVYGEVPQIYTATVTVPGVASPSPNGVLMTFDADGVTTLGSSSSYTQISPTEYTVTISSSVVLPAGSHQIVAHFEGNINYNSSASPPVTQVVNRADTTTSLAPPTSTIITGNPGSLVATVAVTAPGSGTPTGDVKFNITGTASSNQTVPLSGTTASPDLSSLLPGTYQVTAEYLGDDNFNASPASAPVTVIVEQANVTVSIVAIVPNPQEYNTFPVNYFLRLTAPSTGPAPTGTITITASPLFPPFPIVVGSGDLADFDNIGGGVYTGTIQSTGPALSPNVYIIRANYSGDGNYEAATGFGLQIVNKTTGPTVTIGPPSVTSTNAGPVRYVVTWTDPFLDTSSVKLKRSDITLNATGNATGVVTVGNPVVVNATTVRAVVTIRDITGRGRLGISIGPNTAHDQFENLAGPAGPSATFRVTGAPKLTIAYVNPPSVLPAGATTVLTIRVANIGTQMDTGVFVTATLPDFSTLDRSRSSAGWRRIGPGVFRLDIGTLKAGQARNLKFAVHMVDQAPVEERVRTSASVFDASSANPRATVWLFFIIGPSGHRWPTF